jgi:8-oxo-dGTP diphosphatase
MEISELQEKTHYIAVTGIIFKDGKYLICKRSEKEKAFPNKWCVPGGKIEKRDIVDEPKNTKDYWFDVLEKTLRREIIEETSLKIKNIGFVSNLAFLRPNGFATIIISLYAEYESGDVVLGEDELVDYAWVTPDEAKEYDLLENLHEQILKVHEVMRYRHGFE